MHCETDESTPGLLVKLAFVDMLATMRLLLRILA